MRACRTDGTGGAIFVFFRCECRHLAGCAEASAGRCGGFQARHISAFNRGFRRSGPPGEVTAGPFAGFGLGPGYSRFVNHTGVNSAYGGHPLFGTIAGYGRCGCRLRNTTARTCYRCAWTPFLQRSAFRASGGQGEQSGAKGRDPRKEARPGSRPGTESDVTALRRRGSDSVRGPTARDVPSKTLHKSARRGMALSKIASGPVHCRSIPLRHCLVTAVLPIDRIAAYRRSARFASIRDRCSGR